MSAKDIFHQSVCIALEKDGWNITHDPLYLKVNDVEFYIDLGAERWLFVTWYGSIGGHKSTKSLSGKSSID
jgi:hypothetical protein